MRIVGLSGSLTHPSRTTALVEHLLQVAGQHPGASTSLVSIADLGAQLGASLDPGSLPDEVRAAQAQLAGADLILVGTPIYKAAYTGLLKHFFDLLDPEALRGKTAILAATGGSEHHALVLEHQLRPLLSFFGVHSLPTTLFARDTGFAKDGAGRYTLTDPALLQRARQAVHQGLGLATNLTASPAPTRLAA